MNKKIDSDIIKKYTDGHYNFSDLKKLKIWFRDESYQKDIKQAVNENWNQFELPDNFERKDLSSVFNNLKNKIQSGKQSLSLKQKVLKFYFRAAAILLIPLLIYSAYTITEQFLNKSDISQWIEVVSPYGTRTHFNLPDGSKVSLNSGAHLKYNIDFKDERKLFIDGEAYFDVFHDASSPFIVQTDVIDIQVLGTKFSVSNASNENSIDVVLEEGKVQLTDKNNSFSEILKPDERFAYDKKSHTGKIENVDAKYLTSWKDGILMFRSETLEEVMKKIGRWYNVEIELNDVIVKNLRYRATFQNEPLEEVLRLISLTSPIKYEIKERMITNDNQYERKVVIISSKR